MKISYAILIGFFAILLMFSITTYLNYRQADEVDANTELTVKSAIILRHSNRFQRNILGMVSGLRGYILTQERFFMQTYDSASLENKEILAELDSLIKNDTEKRILAEINALNDEWVKEYADPLIRAKETSTQSDSSLATFKTLYQQKLKEGSEARVHRALQNKFREFANLQYDKRDIEKAKLAATIRETKNISFALTLISIVTGVGIALFLAHNISSKVVSMVQMADSIAGGNYNVAVRVTENNEFTRLSQALNNMAKILSENFRQLERKNEDLDQFAHIASHDIKAPLRGIANVVDWIEEDYNAELPAKVKEYLALIKSRIKRAENLLSGILLYSRISREKMQSELVDINELIAEIKEDLDLKPGMILHVQSNMPVLLSERVPLLQLFSNLIGNAVKYHDKADGLIKVYYTEEGAFYEFYVEDNGPGISPEYHEKIFKIFQTLTERDSFESTGIGLAIVKKILSDRNLSIYLHSVPGGGSTFSFLWPKIHSMTRVIKILLVEDDSLDQMDVERTLTKRLINYKLHVVTNGEEALKVLGSDTNAFAGKPDLILLDLNMPKMNGVEFLQKFRTNDAWKDIKVFVLTTSEEKEDKAKVAAFGVSGFITKPLKLESPSSIDAFNLMIDLMNMKH